MEEFTWKLPESDRIIEVLASYGSKLIFALFVLVVGLWLIRKLTNLLKKAFSLRKFDANLQRFLLQVVDVSLKILLFISVVSMLGIQMTSFVAILGALSLAFGMALSGTMQNFAGGVMLLIFKPFKSGDYIESQGFSGTVKEIQIFHTILTTSDNKRVIIPNGGLSTGSSINYSHEPSRRVEWTIGISYNDDIDKAREVLLNALSGNDKLVETPAPSVVVSSLGGNSVNLTIKAWVKTEKYWDLFYEMNENFKKELDKSAITIPFPQSDVHIYKHDFKLGKL